MPAGDQGDETGFQRVIDEDLFTHLLIRERKRSDRSNRLFGLLVVRTNAAVGTDSSALWDAAIDAVAVAKRETDMVGWLKSGAAIGVILPEIRGSDVPDLYERFGARFERALAESLDAERVGGFSMR